MSEKIQALENEKYINLETAKKDGTAVKTPVWFVISDGIIYVITRSKTGKIKRIKNNSAVRIAPCDIKGKVHGEWSNGKAMFVEDDIAKNAIKLRSKKYGIMAKLAGFLSKSKGDLVVVSIQLDL